MPGPSKTPAQIRYGAMSNSAPLSNAVDSGLRPMLVQARHPGEESDGFAEWLGHLAAGRIVVR